jgi:predicted  nucleic acid-binding Zn-ribbon protein
MADKYPKSYDELLAENETLQATVARLESSVASLQSAVIARDSDIERLRKPKAPPRVLDKNATDAFQRPAYRR